MSRIFLIRHGQVQLNEENTYVGSTDVPLNATGRSQAAQVAHCLETETIKAIYSSDLQRARETAEIIASHLNLSVSAVPELRELDYGDWEGVAEARVRSDYSDIFLKWRRNPVEVPVPGGETLGELKERVFPAFLRIAGNHAGEDIAVIAHKTVNRVILCCLLGMDIRYYRRIGQDNTALNVIRRREDGMFVVEAINQRDHLHARSG